MAAQDPIAVAADRLRARLLAVLTDAQVAAVWPLVSDAVHVCRCNGTDRLHVRGHRDWCVHRPGGPVDAHAATSGKETA